MRSSDGDEAAGAAIFEEIVKGRDQIAQCLGETSVGGLYGMEIVQATGGQRSRPGYRETEFVNVLATVALDAEDAGSGFGEAEQVGTVCTSQLAVFGEAARDS